MPTTLFLFINSLGLCFADTLPGLENVIDFILEPDLFSRSTDFFLFTRNQSSGFSISPQCSNLKSSDFSSKKPTKIIIHGWTDSAYSPWVQDMRQTYLAKGDYNVICLDWYPDSLKDYLVAARHTHQVGRTLAKLLKCLKDKADLELKDVHMIGHSLGAHIAGFASKSLADEISTVGRITGLDPARPSFETFTLISPGDHLTWNDALFVDVIHTCAGVLGFLEPIGHVDFYPNRGMAPQPGCPIWNSQACSHSRSHQYMNESILSPLAFPAVKCNTGNAIIDYTFGKCRKNRIAIMGESADTSSRGIYFLETSPQFPFGKGSIG